MRTKLSLVLDAMDRNDWPRAFSVASKFARLGDQKEAIMRAQSALLEPDFYRQLGRDPAAIIEDGKAAMRARFEPMRDGYDAGDDLENSLNDAYSEIKQRKQSGGPGWKPRTP